MVVVVAVLVSIIAISMTDRRYGYVLIVQNNRCLCKKCLWPLHCIENTAMQTSISKQTTKLPYKAFAFTTLSPKSVCHFGLLIFLIQCFVQLSQALNYMNVIIG